MAYFKQSGIKTRITDADGAQREAVDSGSDEEVSGRRRQAQEIDADMDDDESEEDEDFVDDGSDDSGDDEEGEEEQKEDEASDSAMQDE